MDNLPPEDRGYLTGQAYQRRMYEPKNKVWQEIKKETEVWPLPSWWILFGLSGPSKVLINCEPQLPFLGRMGCLLATTFKLNFRSLQADPFSALLTILVYFCSSAGLRHKSTSKPPRRGQPSPPPRKGKTRRWRRRRWTRAGLEPCRISWSPRDRVDFGPWKGWHSCAGRSSARCSHRGGDTSTSGCIGWASPWCPKQYPCFGSESCTEAGRPFSPSENCSFLFWEHIFVHPIKP